MNYFIAVDPGNHAIQQKPVDILDWTFNIAFLITLATLVGILFQATKSIVSLTTKATQIKADFEKMDLGITHKLDNLTERIDNGFKHIDIEWEKLERRLNKLDSRIRQIENYVAKTGFHLREDIEEN